MPRTRSLAWSELKIGIVAVVALVMATIMIFLLSGDGGFFWQRYSVKTVFPNVAGVKAGSPVRVAGVEVGAVEEVQFAPNGVELVLQIRDDMRPMVTDRSLASIGSVSLLGEGAVDISPSPEGTPVPDWGYVRSGLAEGSFASVTEQATAGLNEVRELLKDVRGGRGTMGRLFTDDALYRNLDAFVQSAERVTASIQRGQGTLGKLSRDPALYNELQASVKNLAAITAGIRSGDGTLGQLATDPTLAKSLTATTQNVEGLTGRLNRGEGTAGKLFTDESLYKRLDSMAGRLDQVSERLSAGQGTMGQLLQDKQLYENMNQTVAELRSLITNINKDPKKYLNIKVSIF
ncbi:MAG: MlaD family protein [Acidobacteria bacterium]|nr:MlaD family protein [Acidobacteriota bacterium]